MYEELLKAIEGRIRTKDLKIIKQIIEIQTEDMDTKKYRYKIDALRKITELLIVMIGSYFIAKGLIFNIILQHLGSA